MTRENLPQICELRAIQTDLVKHHIDIDHRDRRLQRCAIRVEQGGGAGVCGVEGALDDQTGHAAGDAEGDEFRAGEVVDEEEGEDTAAEGEGDPPALVEELRVSVEAEARVEGGAVVLGVVSEGVERCEEGGGDRRDWIICKADVGGKRRGRAPEMLLTEVGLERRGAKACASQGSSH